MKLALSIVVSAVLSSVGASQIYTSTPPVCFSFNDTATLPAQFPAFPTAPVTFSGQLLIHFAAPVTITLDRLDLVVQTGSIFGRQLGYLVTVYQTASIGSPVGSALGTYQSSYLSGLGFHDWAALGQYPWQAPAPILLVGGQTYALSIQGLSTITFICNGLTYDPAGATQLQYQFIPYGGCGTSFPPTGTIGLMARFRGASCGPGPLASVGPNIGVPCGLSAGSLSLVSSTPPVLGTIWTGTTVGSTALAGLSAYLFWSGGLNLTGSPIVPGSSCLTYLDLNSVAMLYALGVEPFAAATIPASGSVTWAGLVPASPAVAGTIIGIQVLVIDPAGTIPFGGGLFGEVSNALKLTLGF